MPHYNTLHVCTTPQQNFSTSLLHGQGHIAEVLGVKLVFEGVLVYKTILGKVKKIN